MVQLSITAYTLTNALGRGKDACLTSFKRGTSGLTPCDLVGVNFPCWIGKVIGVEQEPVMNKFINFDCRNNRLAQIGLEQDNFRQAIEQAKVRYGKDRIGLFLGTSTSGIQQAEIAYTNLDNNGMLPKKFHYNTTQNCFSLTDFCRLYLDINGPAVTVSTACSSSAKVFAMAQRYIENEICDAAIVGGVDSLCLTTLYGFHSLELIAPNVCAPWGKERNGISIGEAAGFALIEKNVTSPLTLLGCGETSDAYHIATPHPQGIAAVQAISQALDNAKLSVHELDYINLHGTGTQLNDSSEDAALRNFAHRAICSSTKGWTGHTLGAAGITEAAIVLMSLEYGFIPANLFRGEKDPQLATPVIIDNLQRPIRIAMSNSFGFGGTNCSLIFGKAT